MTPEELHRLAKSIRDAADHPAPIADRLKVWRSGFCDGLFFAAAVLDLAADGKLVSDAEGELLAALMKPFSVGTT